MSQISHDLYASHKIVQILESSKLSLERIVHELPILFTIIDQNGTLLKANSVAISLANVSKESILNTSISSIFSSESFKIFKHKLDQLVQKTESRAEFELDLDNSDINTKIFIWDVAPIKSTDPAQPRLFSVIGTDITQIRKYEKQLIQIFSSMPIGIITASKDCKIDKIYSSFSEFLLNTSELADKNLHDVLFAKGFEHFTETEKEGIRNLKGFYDQKFEVFDVVQCNLPNLIQFTLKDSGEVRYLGLKYQPIVFGGLVKKVMIIIEDRTKLVELESSQKRTKEQRDSQITKIVEIQCADQELLESSAEEISSLVDECIQALTDVNYTKLCRGLHGIKGNGRINGFNVLVEKSHALEHKVQQHINKKEVFEMNDAVIPFSELKREWDDYSKLLRTLRGEGQGQGGSHSSEWIEGLELFINGQIAQKSGSKKIEFSKIKFTNQLQVSLNAKAQKTAKELKKEVVVEFDWNGIPLTLEQFNSVSIAIFHIFNNALDHGIEASPERIQKSKKPIGKISVQAVIENNAIFIKICDDGRGFQADAIAKSALKKGLITAQAETTLKAIDKINLIFEPNFSTRESATLVSGRGIGLDAAKYEIEKIGGQLKALEQSDLGGAGFLITFNIDNFLNSFVK